jgi:hypothetical protein
VGETLRAMEEESAFVSDSKNVAIIEGLCAACVRDLNASGECVAALDAGNALFLKLQPRLLLAAAPSLHAVPVSVVPLSALSSSSSWDLTVRRVALAMDGERCVRDIARATGVDPPLVAQAVRTLITFGVAAMTEPAGLVFCVFVCLAVVVQLVAFFVCVCVFVFYCFFVPARPAVLAICVHASRCRAVLVGFGTCVLRCSACAGGCSAPSCAAVRAIASVAESCCNACGLRFST